MSSIREKKIEDLKVRLREMYKDVVSQSNLTDEQKMKINELADKGWIDVTQPYYEDCIKRNRARQILDSASSETYRKMYKTDESMTPEQEEKWEKLHEMGWRDVAKIYSKACEEENYTEEYKARLLLREFVGDTIDLDDDD